MSLLLLLWCRVAVIVGASVGDNVAVDVTGVVVAKMVLLLLAFCFCWCYPLSALVWVRFVGVGCGAVVGGGVAVVAGAVDGVCGCVCSVDACIGVIGAGVLDMLVVLMLWNALVCVVYVLTRPVCLCR